MNRLSASLITTTVLVTLSLGACSSGASSDTATPAADAGATSDASVGRDGAAQTGADGSTPDAATANDGAAPGADGSTPATDGGASAYDIKVPATIRDQAPGQTSITDASYFDGFAGSHVFGRGGKAPSAPETPTLITDCKLTVGPTGLKLEGGGETIDAPLISTNPNAKTQVISFGDPRKLGGVDLLSFYAADGSGISVGVTYGLVTAVAGGKPGTAISCNKNTATSITLDRSAETLTFSTAALSPFLQKAGNNSTYTQNNIATSDLGGAAGTATFGRGLVMSGNVFRLVDDCRVEIAGGTITVSGGGLSSVPATFTAAANDSMLLVQTPTDKQFNFQPEGGVHGTVQVNVFGFVTQAIGKTADGTSITCPR